MSLFHKKPKVETTDLTKRFDLISRVGQGSMSKVWRADDPINGRFVAVKLLDKEKTARYEARFKGLNKPNEGDIAFALRHPNIVHTYEVGYTPEEEMFLVMEYVDGCGLSLLVDLQSDRMRRYRTRYMIQIGDALSYFHQSHWIHRDVCPRNIMVTEDNRIKMIDFGLTVPDTPDFRKPGNRTGTANYMAPELIKRQQTDQRIDIFSYAVTCYEMYAKRHPWDAAMTIDAVMQHINKPPIPIQELVPRIDSQIGETIMKGLAATPSDRWTTMEEMVTQFRQAEARLVTATRHLLTRRKKAKAAQVSGPTAAGMTETAVASGDSIEMPVPKMPTAASGRQKATGKPKKKGHSAASGAFPGKGVPPSAGPAGSPADESGKMPDEAAPGRTSAAEPDASDDSEDEPLSLD